MTDKKIPSQHRCSLSDVIGWGLETLACNQCGRSWLRKVDEGRKVRYSCTPRYPTREEVEVKPPAQVIGAAGWKNDSEVKGF